MKIALGPLLYYWPRDTVLRYYETIAETAVDLVYLGETVCSRRHELRLSDWLELAARLRAAGKDVVLSTQVLLESGSEVGTMHRVTTNGEYLVEANDMGAVRQLAGNLPFVAGPHLNLYNLPSLAWMASLGASRWVVPLEMRRTDLLVLQKGKPAGLQTEVFAYGRMPLAFSARCFTARQRNLPKDDCQFSCIEHPDGLTLRTREQQAFLVLNGIQTQSAKVCNLVQEMDDMEALGVDIVRLSPQAQHMPEVIAIFDAVRRRELDGAAALARLLPLMPEQACNGYWHGHPGMDQVAADAAPAQEVALGTR
ncbi:MAG: U32 family peptidase [Rhodoferax sp.]|jgi:collagenase-like PrtC family protease|nr:U32 family peptidase [Rhodoferax sp.]MBP9929278.1 U32 family peptidase [Rhodoferax sp.]HQX59715.1 U32 family peptidase [Burkholderiaceae bacterium]HQZ06188.1 U32 family peptidase [Burkholderiaceae bacterium]HRA61961.1 U32 family peptidase [Burkholderiaceae bacterium]